MAITFQQFKEGEEFFIGKQRRVSAYVKSYGGIPKAIHFSDSNIALVQMVSSVGCSWSFEIGGSIMVLYTSFEECDLLMGNR